MDLLANLNPQQRQAVTAPPGQTLVLAGPGSGKTRVLTQRIAYLISEMGVPPYRLLAVTFTNKAAREMAARVQALVENNLEGIWLGTFHAMCARILRRESALLPFKSNFVIMDEDDQQTLIKRTLRELNIDDKLYRPVSVHAAISAAKNNLQSADDFPARNYREEVTARVYKRYQEMLVANNAVDFDDLLLEAVKLLRDNPQVRDAYAARFECVLVDEFQDTNLAQYELLKLLSSHHHNLFVVGDEDQSIYRWRGADYRNVLRFEEDYRNCQKILLEQNYRSTQTVLDAARAVIDRNTQRTPKHLFSDRGAGERIILYEAIDDHAEAAYVVDTIQQALSAHKAKGSDFAIMYRTNAQSRLLEEAFLRAAMPYRLVGAQRFYGRREVKDVIAYLRLVSNPSDEISLGRVINVPPRGIGDKTVLGLQLAARQAKVTPGDVLLDLGEKGEKSNFWLAFNGRGANLLADVGNLLVDWQKLREGPLPTLFDAIIDSTGYESYINDGTDEGKDRWDNVMELRRLAFEYAERGLVAFLENLALVSDQDTLPEKADAPTLLTLHAAKGLEFSQVFITGMDEGLLPHSRSRDDPEEMAEERRLFYVGITRAKNQLYLVRADQRSTFGSFEYSVPSRFLDDIPKEMILRQGAHTHATRTRRTENFSTWVLPP
ncbi:MAG: UvrD-helicase domain-containing protein, partial [Anaerolineaceae bacterium]